MNRFGKKQRGQRVYLRIEPGITEHHPIKPASPYTGAKIAASSRKYQMPCSSASLPARGTNRGDSPFCSTVAGTVGGTGAMSAGKYEGVAPGANLVGYGSGAALFILDAIGGFDYALTNQSRFGVRVITNSWGSSGGFDPEDPVNVASKAAYDRGIAVTFAAGNEGPGENTQNPYAKAPWVISVAAGDKQGKLADFSSRGLKGAGGTFTVNGESWTWEDRPTITAPGVDVISTRVLAPVSSLAAADDVNNIEPVTSPSIR